MRRSTSHPLMTVDCDSCPVRDLRCADCLVTALRGMPVVVSLGDGELELDLAEQRTVARLVSLGLVAGDHALGASGAVARREPWTGVRAAG